VASTRTLQRSFWKDLPPSSMALLLGAVAATFASFGFLTDIASLGSDSPAGLAYKIVIAAFSASYAWCAMGRTKAGSTRAGSRSPAATSAAIWSISWSLPAVAGSATSPTYRATASRPAC
jgi:hypothetical protein